MWIRGESVVKHCLLQCVLTEVKGFWISGHSSVIINAAVKL